MTATIDYLPARTTFTVEQALQDALGFTDLQAVLIIAKDRDGDLMIRSSRMDTHEANYLVDIAKTYILGIRTGKPGSA